MCTVLTSPGRCNVTSAALPPSRSHRRRGYHWLPAAPGAFHLGTLTITQGRGADTYLVDEDTTAPFPCRRFLLCKQDEGGEVYEVTATPDGALCSGHWCGRHPACKHRDAVLDLLRSGELDPAAAA